MTANIEVSGLTKWFDDYCAVKSIDFSVPEGEVLALLGPSGCGKTTTLRSIAGLEDPSSGRISIGDQVVYSSETSTLVPPERRGVGLVFQSYALWPHLTVAENVSYGLKVLKLGKREIAERTTEILKTVDLAPFADRYPGSLSGGQQQRVALARSLVMEPRVLLFDEPLSNLDSKLRETMRADLRKLVMRIGLTAVYVTHDQSEAMVIADRIILMNDGRIEQAGTAAEIYDRPRSEFVADFIGSANFFDATVLQQSKDRVEVRTAGDHRLWAELPSESVPEGSVRIAVRPEKIELAKGAQAAANSLEGVVVTSEFLGDRTVYEVDCGGGLRLNVQSTSSKYRPQDAVTLSFPEPDLILLES